MGLQDVAKQPPSKRVQQKEARRNAIIDAGFQEFALQGFTATKLDDVAVRAGIGKGTIYLYFDSKESLFEEVIRKNMLPVLEEASRNAAEFKGSAVELLTMHFRAMYEALHRDKMPQLVAMIMGEASRFPDMAEFFYNEVVSHNKEMVSSLIRKGIDSGEFRDSFPVNFTQILIAPAIISALWRLQFEAHSPLDLDAYAEAHIDFVLRGLKA
jgi:AcrR family transcriptional regulator